MTASEIRDLFAYNVWANRRTFESAAQVPPEQYHLDLKSSHGGLHGTLIHLVGAEQVWLARWTDGPDKTMLKPESVPSLQELIARWETVHANMARFTSSMTDARLKEHFTVRNLKGDEMVNTFQEMLQHLANHSTYHRGQAAGMMRQFGIAPQATDLIRYYRELRTA